MSANEINSGNFGNGRMRFRFRRKMLYWLFQTTCVTIMVASITFVAPKLELFWRYIKQKKKNKNENFLSFDFLRILSLTKEF